uniref:FTH domain-containing protein n=1 Tax=Panagrellus redivivus TaxID=6233 RepID=A0A7E4V8J9_PANRE
MVSLNDSCFTFDELKYALKGCGAFYARDSKFTEPVTFSELWPLLTYCDIIELDILNMIYDENIGQAMLKYRGVKFKAIEFCNLPVSQNIFMSIIDYFLSFSEFPYRVEMSFPAETAPSELQMFLVSARQAMENAGYKCEDTDDHIEFKYDHLHNKIPLTSDIKYIIVNTLYGRDGNHFMFTPPFGRKFLFTEPSSDSSEEGSLSDDE